MSALLLQLLLGKSRLLVSSNPLVGYINGCKPKSLAAVFLLFLHNCCPLFFDLKVQCVTSQCLGYRLSYYSRSIGNYFRRKFDFFRSINHFSRNIENYFRSICIKDFTPCFFLIPLVLLQFSCRFCQYFRVVVINVPGSSK